MDESEYAELLSHIRRRVRDAGAVDLDDAIAAAGADDLGERRSSAAVVAYLEQLRAALRLRSGLAGSDALGWLKENVATRDGEPVAGLVLDASDARRAYGQGADDDPLIDLTAPRTDRGDPAGAAIAIAEIDHLLERLDDDRAIEDRR